MDTDHAKSSAGAIGAGLVRLSTVVALAAFAPAGARAAAGVPEPTTRSSTKQAGVATEPRGIQPVVVDQTGVPQGGPTSVDDRSDVTPETRVRSKPATGPLARTNGTVLPRRVGKRPVVEAPVAHPAGDASDRAEPRAEQDGKTP